MSDLFDEKLNWFKDNEQPEVVLIVANNDDLIKIIVAWLNTRIERKNETIPLKGEQRNETWDWLWNNVYYSLEEIKIKSMVHPNSVKIDLETLIANRIIYPDGTINSLVQRYMREQVVKLFATKQRKAANAQKLSSLA